MVDWFPDQSTEYFGLNIYIRTEFHETKWNITYYGKVCFVSLLRNFATKSSSILHYHNSDIIRCEISLASAIWRKDGWISLLCSKEIHIFLKLWILQRMWRYIRLVPNPPNGYALFTSFCFSCHVRYLDKSVKICILFSDYHY